MSIVIVATLTRPDIGRRAPVRWRRRPWPLPEAGSADAVRYAKGVVNGHRAGGVVANENGSLDAEHVKHVEHGPELVNVVCPAESPGWAR
jgi:hypothetical protein